MRKSLILLFFLFFYILSTPLSIANVKKDGASEPAVYISSTVLSEEELQTLNTKPLIIGYASKHQPLSYLDKNNNPKGIIVDVFKLLAKQYNFKIEFRKLERIINDSIRTEADILIPIVRNENLQLSNFVLTDTYLSLPFMIFTLTDTINFEIYKNTKSSIVLYDYLFLDMQAVRKDFANKDFVIFNSYNDVFVAYNKGLIDALMATDTSLYFNQYIVYKTKQLTENNHDFAVHETNHKLNLKAFVSKDLTNYADYVAIFNKLFAGLDQDLISNIKIAESQKFYPDLSIVDFFIQHSYTIMVGVLAFLFLVLSLILVLNNRKKTDILKIANTDELTGLQSKHKFYTDIRAKLKNAKVNEYKYLTIRLDNFQVINEMFSYEKGTQTIVAISDMLKANFAGQDVLICREKPINFSFFCKTETALNLKKLCENELSSVIKKITSNNYETKVSIGKYIIENPNDSVDEISNRVRIAVKKGSENYNNTFTVFDNHMQIAEKMSYDIVFRMKQALTGNEFFVTYQPKVDLQSMKILGAEALVRWQPEGAEKPIYPDKFIPLFEENGFVVELDLFVFEEVCKFIKANLHIFPSLKISINMSPVTLFAPNIGAKAMQILKKYGLPSRHIIIELTESATNFDSTFIDQTINMLKNDGFEVSIDDFGTGLSSLNRLGSLDVDEIKLDKDFLDFDRENIKKIFIVQDVVSMIKRLGIRIVCEGIETHDQAMWLKDLGCTIGQGYYFAKPLLASQFKTALMQPNKSEVVMQNPEQIMFSRSKRINFN